MTCLFFLKPNNKFDKAIKDAKWRKTINKEIESIKKNDTNELTLRKGRKTNGVK